MSSDDIVVSGLLANLFIKQPYLFFILSRGEMNLGHLKPVIYPKKERLKACLSTYNNKSFTEQRHQLL